MLMGWPWPMLMFGLISGLKESPVIPHKDMLTVSEILEECKKQIGIKFPQDV